MKSLRHAVFRAIRCEIRIATGVARN